MGQPTEAATSSNSYLLPDSLPVFESVNVVQRSQIVKVSPDPRGVKGSVVAFDRRSAPAGRNKFSNGF